MSDSGAAFGVRAVTIAAAPLIADALDRIWEDPDLGVHVARFVAVTYMDAGFDLRVSITLPDETRAQVFDHFTAVFTASPWGFGSRTAGPDAKRVAMDFRIPESLTPH